MKVFKLENTKEKYINAIAQIEKDCFSSPNSKEQIESDIQNENADIFAAVTENDTLCGYVGLHHVLDEGYMDNLAVDTQFRRRGIARALLCALDGFAKEKPLSFITLEVRESNIAAQRLYENCGYSPVGKRKNFYSNPTETAILMTKYYD